MIMVDNLPQVDTGLTALEAAYADLLNEYNTLAASVTAQAAREAAGIDYTTQVNRINALTTEIESTVAQIKTVNTQIQTQ